MTELLKIIRVSNFDLETYEQKAIAENIPTAAYAKTMVDALQETCGRHSPDWYRVVPQSTRLWRGMADLVGEAEDPEKGTAQGPAPAP